MRCDMTVERRMCRARRSCSLRNQAGHQSVPPFRLHPARLLRRTPRRGNRWLRISSTSKHVQQDGTAFQGPHASQRRPGTTPQAVARLRT
eukprot:scaffold567_cov384-Prasinococcus_capsulatus_cf.AAC.15